MKSKEFISDGHSRLVYHPDAFVHIDPQSLLSDVEWRQNRIRIFGKEYPEPRLTAWYGPTYSYSSVHWPWKQMTLPLGTLCATLKELTGFPFNAVLINRYRNGQDAMGWHRDNEPEIDQSLIASVSFGATRDFLIRRRGEKKNLKVKLAHGSLLLMHNLQNDYEHAIPRRLRISEERVNLTFRRIIA